MGLNGGSVATDSGIDCIMPVLLEHSGTGLDPLIGTRLWLLTARGIIRLHRPGQMFKIAQTIYLTLHPNKNVQQLAGPWSESDEKI
jgi:hypothetical protein